METNQDRLFQGLMGMPTFSKKELDREKEYHEALMKKAKNGHIPLILKRLETLSHSMYKVEELSLYDQENLLLPFMKALHEVQHYLEFMVPASEANNG